MNYDKVPEELKQLRQWVLWKAISKDGAAPTKIPYQANGKAASSTDKETWNEFRAIRELSDNYSGIGFVFSESDPFCGIDFDACRDPHTGKISDWAKEWIKKLNSYSEISPSQTGVKVWIRGKLPLSSGKKALLQQYQNGSVKTPAIEVYDHARYFAVTGQGYDKLPHEPQDRQDVLNELCSNFFKPEIIAVQPAMAISSLSDRARKYVNTMPGAISGSGGHDQTFRVACILTMGFCLSREEAFGILAEYNRRCDPPWTDRELRHKIESASKQAGPRGYLKDAQDDSWKSVKIPEYKEIASEMREETGPTEPTITTLEESAGKYIESLSNGKQNLINTGIYELDFAIGGGVAEGEMVIIAARPSHGKSAFALQALTEAGYRQMPSAIISQEMSAIALGKRAIQYASRTKESEWLKDIDSMKTEVTKHFGKRAPCYVVEGCGTVERAVKSLERLKAEKGIKVAAIDYAQILTSKGRSRYEEITKTSIALRQFASTSGMVLYVLCQLSRGILGREKFIPRMDDLKDSGQLEQDADVIIFLVWPHRLNPARDPKEFEIWVGKNRNRAIVRPAVDCEFNPERQMILMKNTPFGEIL